MVYSISISNVLGEADHIRTLGVNVKHPPEESQLYLRGGIDVSQSTTLRKRPSTSGDQSPQAGEAGSALPLLIIFTGAGFLTVSSMKFHCCVVDFSCSSLPSITRRTFKLRSITGFVNYLFPVKFINVVREHIEDKCHHRGEVRVSGCAFIPTSYLYFYIPASTRLHS